jgi:hypothetical protein
MGAERALIACIISPLGCWKNEGSLPRSTWILENPDHTVLLAVLGSGHLFGFSRAYQAIL